MSTTDNIKAQQREWAEAEGIALDAKGYVDHYEEHMFRPLNSDSEKEFGVGAGAELKGKMRAVHSSSALVCNVFDYWRSHGVSVIGAACGVMGATALSFESTHPTGLGGTPPHLDVELTGGDLPTAIESKFTESYGSSKPIKHAYTKTALWDEVGMPTVGRFLQRVVGGDAKFSTLDTGQLFAHLLGLSRSYGRDFRFIYLWFDAGDDAARKHAAEVEQFRAGVAQNVLFEPLTYQTLFKKLSSKCAEHADYWQYINGRYNVPVE